MAELVDASDSKSDSARSAGSIPARGTIAINNINELWPSLKCGLHIEFHIAHIYTPIVLDGGAGPRPNTSNDRPRPLRVSHTIEDRGWGGRRTFLQAWANYYAPPEAPDNVRPMRRTA